MNKSDYKNVLLAGAWESHGKMHSMPLSAEDVKKITATVEEGGRFFIRKRTAESIAKARNPERTPPYFIEFIPAAEVQAYAASRDAKKTESPFG